jgi:N-methylhydantoinase B
MLDDVEYSLIAERRRHSPRGSAGGEDGAPGVDRVNGNPIAGKSRGILKSGDLLRIETPGGGAHGRSG